MLDETGHDLHLVFGTSHPRGLEKMKDAMWKVDPVQGMRYRDPRDPDQIALDLAVQPNTAPLRRAILAELEHGERTVVQLKEHALLETVYRWPHVTQCYASSSLNRSSSANPGGGSSQPRRRFALCRTPGCSEVQVSRVTPVAGGLTDPK